MRERIPMGILVNTACSILENTARRIPARNSSLELVLDIGGVSKRGDENRLGDARCITPGP